MNLEESQREESLRSLIERVVNGEASPEQSLDLEQRLLADERARNAYLDYVNLHAALARQFLASDASEPLADDDLAELPLLLSREGLAKANRPRRSWFTGVVILLGAVVALAAWGAYAFLPLVDGASTYAPVVVRQTGEIKVLTAGGSLEIASVGRSIAAGETLLVAGDGEVVLRYPDQTEIELSGEATIVVERSPQGGKQLALQHGMLEADVAPQSAQRPLLIVTPHTTVRVLGTRFELATDQVDGTRLDLESGRVELVRGGQQPVYVEPMSIAVVPSTAAAIHISPRPAIRNTPEREATFPGVKSIAFDAEGAALIGASHWQAVYWFEDGRLEANPLSSQGRKGHLLKHHSQTVLAFEDEDPRRVVVWNSHSRQSEGTFTDFAGLERELFGDEESLNGRKPPVKVVAMSPQGDWLAFAGNGRTVRLWQAESGKWLPEMRRYDNKPITAIAASADGQTLAVAVRRTRIDLLNSRDGTLIATWPIPHHVPHSLAFSADGRRLAIGYDGRVKVHDAASGEEIALFEQPGAAFLKVALSPDGQLVATASQSHRVRLWDLTTNSELPMMELGAGIHDLAFSPNGEHLAVVSQGGRMSVWEVGPTTTPDSKVEAQ
ncbi:FecR domain-containing protein [Lignipirellula cremea]|uniref:WD domain, G-beta repeat n=1 Tax=Lignipirellula cremea TaxID=2528010 RepID=A0A518DKT4_9BACT|nr:FecR domain-containing protein [Lignipirellula cremea]QDU92441.1 WD domain, G-beta repeat [Lignipirellula cremea]